MADYAKAYLLFEITLPQIDPALAENPDIIPARPFETDRTTLQNCPCIRPPWQVNQTTHLHLL